MNLRHTLNCVVGWLYLGVVMFSCGGALQDAQKTADRAATAAVDTCRELRMAIEEAKRDRAILCLVATSLPDTMETAAAKKRCQDDTILPRIQQRVNHHCSTVEGAP